MSKSAKRNFKSEKRRNVWIREDRIELIEKTAKHPSQPLYAVLDDLIDSALRQRRLLPIDVEELA